MHLSTFSKTYSNEIIGDKHAFATSRIVTKMTPSTTINNSPVRCKQRNVNYFNLNGAIENESSPSPISIRVCAPVQAFYSAYPYAIHIRVKVWWLTYPTSIHRNSDLVAER